MPRVGVSATAVIRFSLRLSPAESINSSYLCRPSAKAFFVCYTLSPASHLILSSSPTFQCWTHLRIGPQEFPVDRYFRQHTLSHPTKMEKLEDTGAIHVPFKEPLGRIRGWFSRAWSLKSHYSLLEGDDMYSPTELPLNETERSPPLSRASIGWRPVSPQRLFWLMVPSYAARAFGHGTADSNIPAPNSTSYLNGLRGIASLIVVLQHTIDGDVSDSERRHLCWIKHQRSLWV